MSAQTAAPRAAPTTWSIGLQRGRIELKQFFRERDAVVWTFTLPLILLAIFGTVLDQEVAPGVSFSQYFLAGMIASGLVYTGFQSMAISIAIERDDGTLKRLRGTPMPPASYFIGKVVLVAVTLVAQTFLLLLVGVLLFRIDLPSTAEQWSTFVWLLVLGATTCTLLGIAFSSVPRSGRAASAVVSPIVLVLQFISGVFFVVSQLPEWMQQVASLFPLKWLTQGMRSVFLPDSFAANEAAGSWELSRVAAVLVLWGVIGLVLCLRTFRWHRRSDD
jgi:ABC-2 type transport system permease protein